MHNTLYALSDKQYVKTVLTEATMLFKQERGRYPTVVELVEMANSFQNVVSYGLNGYYGVLNENTNGTISLPTITTIKTGESTSSDISVISEKVVKNYNTVVNEQFAFLKGLIIRGAERAERGAERAGKAAEQVAGNAERYNEILNKPKSELSAQDIAWAKQYERGLQHQPKVQHTASEIATAIGDTAKAALQTGVHMVKNPLKSLQTAVLTAGLLKNAAMAKQGIEFSPVGEPPAGIARVTQIEPPKTPAEPVDFVTVKPKPGISPEPPKPVDSAGIETPAKPKTTETSGVQIPAVSTPIKTTDQKTTEIKDKKKDEQKAEDQKKEDKKPDTTPVVIPSSVSTAVPAAAVAAAVLSGGGTKQPPSESGKGEPDTGKPGPRKPWFSPDKMDADISQVETETPSFGLEAAPGERYVGKARRSYYDAFMRKYMTHQTVVSEGKLSPKESLHRRLNKQKYKISYVQDGKKVDVFASSIRGVRRVIYGKKQYRVRNTAGSDVTSYFKKGISG